MTTADFMLEESAVQLFSAPEGKLPPSKVRIKDYVLEVSKSKNYYLNLCNPKGENVFTWTSKKYILNDLHISKVSKLLFSLKVFDSDTESREAITETFTLLKPIFDERNSIEAQVRNEIFQKYEQKKYKKVSLEECKKVIYGWLSINDKNVIEVVFAFAIAEKIPGDPLWLFLIAPPGGCKTELLRALDGEDFYHLSDLTSKTFISGLMLGAGEERQKIEDLLPQLADKILLMKDFTTILEKPRDERAEIISQLREIYDGMFSKKFGTIDEKVEYRNNFGLIAGVTPIIDKHWKIMQQLGERFLKYRWQENVDESIRRAEENEGKEEVMRQELKHTIMGFLTNLEGKEIQFPDDLIEPLIRVAKFLAICRTPITIHSGSSEFYYDFIPTPEQPTRLIKQLKKFAKCLALVRDKSSVTKEEILVAIELALHTCPQDRLDVLKAIEKEQNCSLDGCTITAIKYSVKLPETSIRNICQQLEMLDLVSITKTSKEQHGFKEFVSYYRLHQNVNAVSPPTFMEGSKIVTGGSASINKETKEIIPTIKKILDFVKSQPGQESDILTICEEFGFEDEVDSAIKKLCFDGALFKLSEEKVKAL
ncbi:hypothetical protein HYT57_02035 [Candidatus Woesearchaeota archaeon]|nr:hypothetical protein [Candidatus Woesearchaeota archaeon]